MNIENLPEYVTTKDKSVSIENISEYHFGRTFFEMLKSTFTKYFLCTEKHFFTITSGDEKNVKHSTVHSLHYKALAIDLRIKAFTPMIIQHKKRYSEPWWMQMQQCIIVLSAKLPEYVFVLEKDHLHIQISDDNIKGDPITPLLKNCYIRSIKPVD